MVVAGYFMIRRLDTDMQRILAAQICQYVGADTLASAAVWADGTVPRNSAAMLLAMNNIYPAVGDSQEHGISIQHSNQ